MDTKRAAASARTDRQRQILDFVMEAGSASAADLVELTGKSLMTVHRDVDDLAGRGLVRKYHGGVSALPTSVFESSSDFRMQRQTAAKTALARVALQLVQPGSSVMLDDSTTVLALAHLLVDVSPLTVVTNYRQVLELMREGADQRVIMIGGQYSRSHDSFIGPPDQTNIEAYAVDIAFQSTSTMDARMTYHQEQDIVSMKRAQLRTGARRVLMMDGSKVGKTSLHRFVPVADFTDVIVTDDVSTEMLAELAEVATVHVATV